MSNACRCSSRLINCEANRDTDAIRTCNILSIMFLFLLHLDCDLCCFGG